MVIYKVFCKNYELKQGELMGVLKERRKCLRGKTRVESGLKWAKLVFGQMVGDKQAISRRGLNLCQGEKKASH
jgi:hypothetical protein